MKRTIVLASLIIAAVAAAQANTLSGRQLAVRHNANVIESEHVIPNSGMEGKFQIAVADPDQKAIGPAQKVEGLGHGMVSGDVVFSNLFGVPHLAQPAIDPALTIVGAGHEKMSEGVAHPNLSGAAYVAHNPTEQCLHFGA